LKEREEAGLGLCWLEWGRMGGALTYEELRELPAAAWPDFVARVVAEVCVVRLAGADHAVDLTMGGAENAVPDGDEGD
jgi:hypothetical protein